jgi:3-oxoacyl-[acyl-carrier-protein] synthase II
VTRLDVSSPVYRTRLAAELRRQEKLVPCTDATLITDLALKVALDALADAGLQAGIPARSFGVALGTSHGANLPFLTFVRGRLGLPGGRVDHELLLGTTATIVGQVARKVGAAGPTLTVSTACASSCNSIGRAAELVRGGRADVMLAGGADLYTELSFSGFNVLGLLARHQYRPFDARRDGMLLGDGAAMMVLESEESAHRRGARAYCEIAGHAIGNDAFHATAPEPTGREAARVMRDALRDAGIKPEAVDYVNLHGTGTAANDETEILAIKQVFGARSKQVLLSATKSMLGHTLGAAGAVELAATALGLLHGYAPPMINLETPVPQAADWSFVRDFCCYAKLGCAIKNSFGFSGNLCSLVLRAIRRL